MPICPSGLPCLAPNWPSGLACCANLPFCFLFGANLPFWACLLRNSSLACWVPICPAGAKQASPEGNKQASPAGQIGTTGQIGTKHATEGQIGATSSWRALLPYLTNREVAPEHLWSFGPGRILLGHPTADGHCLMVCPGNAGVLLDKDRPLLEEFRIKPRRPVSASAALLQSTGTLVIYGSLRALWLLQAQVEAGHLVIWANVAQPTEATRKSASSNPSSSHFPPAASPSTPSPPRHFDPPAGWPAPPCQLERVSSQSAFPDLDLGLHPLRLELHIIRHPNQANAGSSSLQHFGAPIGLRLLPWPHKLHPWPLCLPCRSCLWGCPISHFRNIAGACCTHLTICCKENTLRGRTWKELQTKSWRPETLY